MAEISFGDIQIRTAKQTGGQSDQGQFKIAVLGDFSADQTVPAFKSYRVDRDDFDDLIAKINPKLNLSFSNASTDSIELSFSDLEDFHPDHLYSEVSLFGKLRNIRKKLQNKSTFDEAAQQVYQWLGKGEVEDNTVVEIKAEQDIAPNSTTEKESTLNLDDVLAATSQQTKENQANETSESSLAKSLIAQVIAPYVIPKADPRLAELIEGVDLAIANLMRLILHHPSFVALEASWVSLYSLVKEIETDSKLTIEVWNLPLTVLAEDLSHNEDLTQCHFYKKTIQETLQTAGGKPYSLMLGLYQINSDEEQCALLGRVANICTQGNTVFVTNASWSLLGLNNPNSKVDTDIIASKISQDCPLGDTLWKSLRSLTISEYLGLTFPRYAVRYPYGKKSSPIEKFQFQELLAQEEHQGIAGGYGCVAVGILLAQSFRQIGNQFSPGEISTFEKVPTLLIEEEGETITLKTAVRPAQYIA